MPIGIEVDGKSIRKAREDAGLTQRELAQHMASTVDYVKKLERGDRSALGTRRFAACARALNVSPDRIRATTNSDPQTAVPA